MRDIFEDASDEKDEFKTDKEEILTQDDVCLLKNELIEEKNNRTSEASYESNYNDTAGEDYEEAKETDYNYEKDNKSRTVNVTGELTLSEGKRDVEAQRKAGGEDRRENDDGGHIIANRFNPSANEENLLAMDKHLNRGGYKSMENHWAKELEEGNKVQVDIGVYYGETSKRPETIMVKEEITKDEKTVTDYYSFTNENLETQEFDIPQEADDLLEDFSDKESELEKKLDEDFEDKEE